MGTWMKEIPPKMMHDRLGLYKGQWLPEMDRAWVRKEDGVSVYSGADAIMSRLEGTGYIGIVPHSETISVHCADMFPEEYGDIVDFIHVFAEEMELFRDSIEWLLEEEARLIEPTKERTEH